MTDPDRELLGILAVALWAVFLLLAISVLGLLLKPAAAHADDRTPCLVTQTQYLASAGEKTLVASPRATTVILAEINRHRTAAGAFPLEADRILVSPRQVAGQTMLGVVMTLQHCVLLDLARTFRVQDWMVFLMTLGLSQDDFVKEMTA
jgi:hypothetical protein